MSVNLVKFLLMAIHGIQLILSGCVSEKSDWLPTVTDLTYSASDIPDIPE